MITLAHFGVHSSQSTPVYGLIYRLCLHIVRALSSKRVSLIRQEQAAGQGFRSWYKLS